MAVPAAPDLTAAPVTRVVLPAVAARHAAQADLDGDGDGDLLLAGPDRLLRVLLNEPTTGFVDLGTGLPPTAREGIGTRVSAADLDGDGDLDVVACGLLGTDKRRAGCRVFASRLRESGPGTSGALRFEEVAAFGRVPPLLELAAFLLADYDGDRDPDLLLFSAGTAGHLVYRNDSGDQASRDAGPVSE
ncbi:MAG TPA: FG-GAP-like repeat-containing protein, partial [Candidatus Polarisedimenticolia bacterium]|nr:FG-GAP-like repeat-containing protein [Candidatus Polarisedimenticolia bacterium]